MPPPPPHLTVSSSSTTRSSMEEEKENLPAESADSSADALQEQSPPGIQSPTESVIPPAPAPDADTADILDQHEDDVSQFLHNYTKDRQIIDQFDVAQSMRVRVKTPPPPPPPPPPETYEALLDGHPPGRKSPSLPIQETTNRMLFGKNDKALSHRRRMFATTSSFSDYEADLSSTDRAKAKQSVMRFLKDKIRTDWSYTWPRARAEEESMEYEFSDDGVVGWREREDWDSGVSEDDEEYQLEEGVADETDLQVGIGKGSETAIKSMTTASPPTSPLGGTIHEAARKEPSPFRFETPEKVGEIVQKKIQDKKERRRKRRLEMQSWNEGLDCWTRRRDAWVCARKIPPPTSLSPSQDNAPPSPAPSPTEEDPSSSTSKGKSIQPPPPPPITQIPIPHPLIPPENIIRAQIGPPVYFKIYEKVVTLSTTPSVPINLKDITRCCVEGWKREGEWPPRASVPEEPIAGRRSGSGLIRGLGLGSGLLAGGRRDSGGGGGGNGESRRSSLASVLGLERVRSVFGRRGSGSVKDGGVGGGGGGAGEGNGAGAAAT